MTTTHTTTTLATAEEVIAALHLKPHPEKGFYAETFRDEATSTSTDEDGDGKYDGYWWNGVHWILLAGEKASDAMIVRHEMLHELLGRGEVVRVDCVAPSVSFTARQASPKKAAARSSARP